MARDDWLREKFLTPSNRLRAAVTKYPNEQPYPRIKIIEEDIYKDGTISVCADLVIQMLNVSKEKFLNFVLIRITLKLM